MSTKFSEIVATPISIVYVTKYVLKRFFSIYCFDNYDNNDFYGKIYFT